MNKKITLLSLLLCCICFAGCKMLSDPDYIKNQESYDDDYVLNRNINHLYKRISGKGIIGVWQPYYDGTRTVEFRDDGTLVYQSHGSNSSVYREDTFSLFRDGDEFKVSYTKGTVTFTTIYYCSRNYIAFDVFEY